MTRRVWLLMLGIACVFALINLAAYWAGPFGRFSSEQWNAYWSGWTSVATVGILGVAVWVGISESRRAASARRAAESFVRAERRDRLVARYSAAIDNASHLYVEPIDRRSERIAIRATGDHTYTRVRVQWLEGDKLTDLGPAFTLSPDASSIPTLELPSGWTWPPRFLVSYSDSLERRFALHPDGRVQLVTDPTETTEERRLRLGET